jgi:hypothetical protein
VTLAGETSPPGACSPRAWDLEDAMQDATSYAYTLSQEHEGWRWRVYDEDGQTVAGGAGASRAAAQAAVESMLRGGERVEPRSFS